jgi:ComF family protein
MITPTIAPDTANSPTLKLSAAKRWLEAAIGFFYAECCQSCHNERATRAEGYVCAKCREMAEFVKPPFCQRCGAIFQGEFTSTFVCGNCRDVDLYFSHARAAVAANEWLLKMLHEYKYHRALWLEPFFASLLDTVAASALRRAGWDMIIPVPLHPRRKAERQFDQADRLARALSKATGIPSETRVLRRVVDTRTQTLLSRQERSDNMRRAFTFSGHPERVRDRRIILFDDVLTTGATASACARVLRQHGASEVCAWTLARGLLH